VGNASAARIGSPMLSLRQEEVDATNAAVEMLGRQVWAQSMIARLQREGGCSKANMPLMFEIRYGLALHDCGLSPVYEYPTGVGKTSIDFMVDAEARWLIEAYSLAETDAAIAATWSKGEFFGRVLQSPRPIDGVEKLAVAERHRRLEEQKQSVEGETLQTVEQLLSKVSDGKTPLKFPAPAANTYTLLVVDARTLFQGHADKGDLDQIAFGADAVPAEYKCYWPGRDGSLIPIRGFFDEENRSAKAHHFQERVHFVTFIIEKTYERDELGMIGRYIANPHLFDSKESAEEVLATFPLYVKARARAS
jgi:hypothetical protein